MPSGPIQFLTAMPARLIQSTGNLYCSANPGNFSGILRASKSSGAGSEGVDLYAETGQFDFEALTFAKVDGEFYGYFVANYGLASQIKRIPLGSVTLTGEATILANAPAPIGYNDLATDGSFLCWADVEGIRSMPIGGGPVTTLAAGSFGSLYPWGLRLSVLGTTLYYPDGNAILSVPTSGGTPSTVVGNRPSPITALHVLEVSAPVKPTERRETPRQPIDPLEDVVVVWGEADGGVYGMSGEIATYQEPTADIFQVNSVYATDQRVLWMNITLGGTGYQLQMCYGGDTVTLASETATGQLVANNVLADEVAAYWTGTFWVEKYTF